jgi:hypothetical protein
METINQEIEQSYLEKDRWKWSTVVNTNVGIYN